MFETSGFPQSLDLSITCHKHKAGSTCNPSNSRGIPHIITLFSSIGDKRLTYKLVKITMILMNHRQVFGLDYRQLIFLLQVMAQKCFSKLGMYFEASKWLFARPLI
jgi:hypothetical protein